jgi:hypothetical protein
MALSHTDRVASGDAILERLGSPSASLKGDHTAFKKQHATFSAANNAVAKGEAAFDKALALVGKLDAKRDGTVLRIADEMPAAGLGKRGNPFDGFSKYAPVALTKLPYATETLEVTNLVEAILAAAPPSDIVKLCTRLTGENQAADTALKALTKPADALNQARAARDALIPDWEKTLRHLKDTAKVALRDTAGRFDTVFAPPVAVQTNTRPKRRTKKADPKLGDPNAAPAAAPPKAKRRARRK